MNKYELLVIIQQSATEEVREATLEKITNLIVANNGTVESIDKWGMKKFAYPINYKNEGFYALYKLTAPADCPNKVESTLNITENVVRAMFVRK